MSDWRKRYGDPGGVRIADVESKAELLQAFWIDGLVDFLRERERALSKCCAALRKARER